MIRKLINKVTSFFAGLFSYSNKDYEKYTQTTNTRKLPDDAQALTLPVRRYKKSEPLAWGSFNKLKKHLDNLFDELEKTDYVDKKGVSLNVTKEAIKGLRELGPYMMPNVTGMNRGTPVFLEADKRVAPMIAFMGFPAKLKNRNIMKEEDPDAEKDMRWYSQRFVYAMLQPKKDMQQYLELLGKNEIVYEVGSALYVDDDESTLARWARKAKDKLTWVMHYYALDTKTGKSRALKWKERRWTGKHYQMVMNKPPEWANDDQLATILNLFITRDAHWLVTATHGKEKATFCIEQNHAKEYFKDRQIDDNGIKKRIFHWVKSHHRHTRNKIANVKTHMRGNREFDWGRYHIKVRVPGLHTHMLSQFNIEPASDDEKEYYKKKGDKLMSVKKTMHKLDADLEAAYGSGRR